ncbi:hypothetical protein B296_00051380 [Ensete ventricosum]|uniref:Transmembrane 9 superfamily member n=1 Tax=Ensete ventricosum TaxID=4639 RepID=A0A426XFG0_ENSVE|nr:hypothetical protein B296_00051380 [Ensete ventricosum]
MSPVPVPTIYRYRPKFKLNLILMYSLGLCSRYAHDEESAEDQEETGWKYIHGDVFRFPQNKSLLAACLGSGTQLFTLTVFIFILALVGVFYPYNRGALFTALVIIYALTSGIAGYAATSFYCQLEGTNWVCLFLLFFTALFS